MNPFESYRSELEALREKWGKTLFNEVAHSMLFEKVAKRRERRKQFSKTLKQRLYNTQNGICGLHGIDKICTKYLLIPAWRNEIDHKNPNAEKYNAPSNLHLVHSDCNRRKGSSDMLAQSKRYGKTIVELSG